jgi:hypothetical protein
LLSLRHGSFESRADCPAGQVGINFKELFQMAAHSIPELMKKPVKELPLGPLSIDDTGHGMVRRGPEPEYICPIHGDIGVAVQKLFFRLADGKQVVRALCTACVCDYIGTLPIAQLV